MALHLEKRASSPRSGSLSRALAAIVVFALMLGSGLLPGGAEAANGPHRIAMGAYIPHAEYDPALIDGYTRQVGRRPLIVAGYKQWNARPFVYEELAAVWSRGSVPMITWEPWTLDGGSFELEAIIVGAYDRYLSTSAAEAAASKGPILVRFGHEMNGSWYPWGHREGRPPATFIAAWRHVVRIFRAAGAGNVRWVWTPYAHAGGSEVPFSAFYPGDPWVDWVGLDGFNWARDGEWHSFREVFANSYKKLIQMTQRPLMIAETGSGEGGGGKAGWISDALRREIPGFGKIRAVVWFNEQFHGVESPVDSSQASLRAFRASIRAPRYTMSRGQLLAPRLHFTPSR